MIFCLGNKTINMSDDDAVINDSKMALKPYDNNANCIGTILRMINMSDTFAMLLIAECQVIGLYTILLYNTGGEIYE